MDQAAGPLNATQIKFLTDFLGVKLNTTAAPPPSADQPNIDDPSQDLTSQQENGGEDPLKAMVMGLLSTLPGDLKAATGLSPEMVAKLQSLLSSGTTAARAQDYQAALESLNTCAQELAKHKTAERGKEAASAIPEGTVRAKISALEASFAMAKTQRLRSVAGLDDLIKILQADEDTELHDIAGIIQGLRRDLPDALDARLTRITAALESGDAEAVKSETAQATSLVDQAQGYLKDNQPSLELCEDNPFDLTLDVIAPMSEALQAVQQALSRI